MRQNFLNVDKRNGVRSNVEKDVITSHQGVKQNLRLLSKLLFYWKK